MNPRVPARLLLAGAVWVCTLAGATERLFEIDGTIQPRAEASVSLYGANEPFAEAALSDAAGHFRFTRIRAGTYTLAAVSPGRGEARITVEAGPGTAGPKGRVDVTISIPEAALPDFVRRNSVPARELAVSGRARHEYDEAQKALARHDAESAVRHLESAVAISPAYAEAWNNLGTISYQKQQFARAAECFERALTANPAAYEPLVNLGGVLLNLGRMNEARLYNQHAVLVRPDDAVANSQLGHTFFEIGEYGPAERYLRRACELDPAHFSHPQLALAQIHIRENRKAEAVADLESFLRLHPDAPNAGAIRRDIAVLRQ